MDGERGEEKDRLTGKHKEVKLVHEVKMEVDSRDEARHAEKSDLCCDLKGRGGRWMSMCDNIRGMSIIVSLEGDEIM